MTNKQRYTSRLAVYILMTKEDKILLSLRQNTGYADNLYTVPAGHVEEGETIQEATAREAYEEAGVIIAQQDLQLAHIMYRKSNYPYVEFYWSCTRWHGTPCNMETDKCGDLQFFPIKQLPQNTSDNLRIVLKNIKSGSVFSESGW